jgi:hypothetical protein
MLSSDTRWQSTFVTPDNFAADPPSSSRLFKYVTKNKEDPETPTEHKLTKKTDHSLPLDIDYFDIEAAIQKGQTAKFAN